MWNLRLMSLPPGKKTCRFHIRRKHFNMQYKKLSYYALGLIVLTIIACGGGEEKSTTSRSAPAPPAAPSGGNAFDASRATATVTGKVTLDGTAPTPAKLPLT